MRRSPRWPLTIALGLANLTSAPQSQTTLEPWTPGTLDIHHIHTGRGNAAFVQFPDGTTFGGELLPFNRITDGFLAKLNPTATAFVFSTFLGGPAADQINHLQLDPQNNLWITGITGNTNTFVSLVAADGSRLLSNQSAPAGAAGQAISLSSNQLSILGASGAVLRAPAAQLSGVSILGLAGSFEGPSKGRIAPGEFVSLYGNPLGPATGVGAALDGNGRIANQLAGTQVLFNGIPAPLLYLDEGQLNALVPYGIGANATVSVQVNTPAGNSLPATIHVSATQPQVLRNGSKALALNQDGTLNSLANPAAPGSLVTIFASGAGLPRNPLPDGSLAGPTTVPNVAVPAFPPSRFLSCTATVLSKSFTPPPPPDSSRTCCGSIYAYPSDWAKDSAS